MARRPSTSAGPDLSDDERAASSESWLARTAPVVEVQGRAWRTATIRRVPTRRLRYVVVDEVFGDLAELSLSTWPVVDALGRLRFSEATAQLEVDASRMRTFLRRHRMPRKEAGRVLRTGDTFGFVVRQRELDTFLSTLDPTPTASAAERRSALDPAKWGWLEPPVYDVSSDAREAAKLSYNAALTGPLPPEALDRR